MQFVKQVLSCLIVGSLIYSPSLMAQPQISAAMNIKECVDYALKNQPNIKISKFDEYIAQKEVSYLTGVGLPQVSGEIDIQGNIQRPQFIFSFQPGAPAQKVPVGQPWQNTAGVTLSQLVFDGTFFLGLKAAKEYVRLSELNTQRTEDDVINQVVTAYYNALTAKEGGELIDLNIVRLQKLYKDTDAMFRNGLVEKNDLDRIQLSLNNLKTEKDKYNRLLALSIDLLKFQMGMPFDANLSLTEKLPEIDLAKEEILSLATPTFEKRTEFKVLEQQSLLENYNRRRYLMQYMPSVYGFGYYQYNMQSTKMFDFGENATFNTSAAGLKIKVPIFNGFMTDAKVQQSKITLQKIAVAKEMTQRGMEMQLRQAITTLQNSRDSYNAQKENVALAKSIYDNAQTKYKEGVGSSLEVNNAEIAVKESEHNLLNAKLDYLNARLSAWQVKGEIRERFIAQ